MPPLKSTTRRLLELALWLLFVLPAAGAILLSLSLLLYMYWPHDFGEINFDAFTPTQSNVMVLAHGLRDTPASWIDPLLLALRDEHYDGQLMPVDWSRYARSEVRCAIDGRRIGERIGDQIASSEMVKSVHLVGHSCGAFVIYGACQAIKAVNPHILVQTTYLDPVSIYGPLPHYGVGRFGDCADYSDAYIDTQDDVIGSNQLLPHTHTYDVTAVRNRVHSTIPPHVWPTEYYRRLVEQGRMPELRLDPALATRKPEGVLEVVD